MAASSEDELEVTITEVVPDTFVDLATLPRYVPPPLPRGDAGDEAELPPPAAPTHVDVIDGGADFLTLAWPPQPPAVRGVLVARYSPDPPRGWASLVAPAPANELRVGGLRPATRHVFQLRAWGPGGLGAPSPPTSYVRTLGLSTSSYEELPEQRVSQDILETENSRADELISNTESNLASFDIEHSLDTSKSALRASGIDGDSVGYADAYIKISSDEKKLADEAMSKGTSKVSNLDSGEGSQNIDLDETNATLIGTSKAMSSDSKTKSDRADAKTSKHLIDQGVEESLIVQTKVKKEESSISLKEEKSSSFGDSLEAKDFNFPETGKSPKLIAMKTHGDTRKTVVHTNAEKSITHMSLQNKENDLSATDNKEAIEVIVKEQTKPALESISLGKIDVDAALAEVDNTPLQLSGKSEPQIKDLSKDKSSESNNANTFSKMYTSEHNIVISPTADFVTEKKKNEDANTTFVHSNPDRSILEIDLENKDQENAATPYQEEIIKGITDETKETKNDSLEKIDSSTVSLEKETVSLQVMSKNQEPQTDEQDNDNSHETLVASSVSKNYSALHKIVISPSTSLKEKSVPASKDVSSAANKNDKQVDMFESKESSFSTLNQLILKPTLVQSKESDLPSDNSNDKFEVSSEIKDNNNDSDRKSSLQNVSKPTIAHPNDVQISSNQSVDNEQISEERQHDVNICVEETTTTATEMSQQDADGGSVIEKIEKYITEQALREKFKAGDHIDSTVRHLVMSPPKPEINETGTLPLPMNVMLSSGNSPNVSGQVNTGKIGEKMPDETNEEGNIEINETMTSSTVQEVNMASVRITKEDNDTRTKDVDSTVQENVEINETMTSSTVQEVNMASTRTTQKDINIRPEDVDSTVQESVINNLVLFSTNEMIQEPGSMLIPGQIDTEDMSVNASQVSSEYGGIEIGNTMASSTRAQSQEDSVTTAQNEEKDVETGSEGLDSSPQESVISKLVARSTNQMIQDFGSMLMSKTIDTENVTEKDNIEINETMKSSTVQEVNMASTRTTQNDNNILPEDVDSTVEENVIKNLIVCSTNEMIQEPGSMLIPGQIDTENISVKASHESSKDGGIEIGNTMASSTKTQSQEDSATIAQNAEKDAETRSEGLISTTHENGINNLVVSATNRQMQQPGAVLIPVNLGTSEESEDTDYYSAEDGVLDSSEEKNIEEILLEPTIKQLQEAGIPLPVGVKQPEDASSDADDEYASDNTVVEDTNATLANESKENAKDNDKVDIDRTDDSGISRGSETQSQTDINSETQSQNEILASDLDNTLDIGSKGPTDQNKERAIDGRKESFNSYEQPESNAKGKQNSTRKKFIEEDPPKPRFCCPFLRV